VNTVNQFLNWFVAPASHTTQTSGGWLSWFDLLSHGWKTDSSSPRVSSAPTMVDPTNGQVLFDLLGRITSK